MADIVVLIAKDAITLKALALNKEYRLISDIHEFDDTLFSDYPLSDGPPPHFVPPLDDTAGKLEVTQKGVVALAEA